MTSDHPPKNPFRAAGALRPWDEGSEGDENLYVPVDHTYEQYDLFVKYLDDPPRDITTCGRLVVVTGGRGSGKTSLIHRCVHHVKRRVESGKLKVVDVTRHPRLEPPKAGARAAQDPLPDSYLDRLTHHVLTKLNGMAEHFTDPGPNVGPATSAYSKLSAQLKRSDDLAAILLPAFLDQVNSPPKATAAKAGPANPPLRYAKHPIGSYLGFREKRIILFAESQNPEAVNAWYEGLTGDDKAETLVLRLGPLKPDDGWRFVKGRLGEKPPEGVPTVDPTIMINLVANRRSMTLSHLRQLCADLWEEAIAKGSLEITEEDIVRFYDSQADTLPRRPRPGRRRGRGRNR